jgi:glucosamine 6-phosphate synthetase-like amidotransferase/phosphosugar isomerase protein
VSETEKAVSRQAAILGQDWTERLSRAAAKAARGAPRVTFVGTGTSYHCALWAHWLCRAYGAGRVGSRAISTWDFLAGGHGARMGREDLTVVISHRGNRAMTKRALGTLSKNKRVLICAEGAPAGTHPFIHASPPEISSAHTMSLIGAMGAVSELVAHQLPAAKAAKLRAHRELTAEALAVYASREDLEHALNAIVERGSGLHIIGGGAFHAIAMEIELKAREIMHVPAHAYNTEQFLHGPIASVEERDTLVLLPTLNPPKGELLRHLYVERLEACRRAAEAVGALVAEPHWSRGLIAATKGLELPWQAIFALYWGQVLCLASAKRWNINPDLNRRDDPRYEEARRRAEM